MPNVVDLGSGLGAVFSQDSGVDSIGLVGGLIAAHALVIFALWQSGSSNDDDDSSPGGGLMQPIS